MVTPIIICVLLNEVYLDSMMEVNTPTQDWTMDLAARHPNGWNNGKIHIGKVHRWLFNAINFQKKQA
jgi:hypothetical protein